MSEKFEKSFKKHSFCPLFLRRNHTYGIIRITTYMGFTQLALHKFANWLGKSSPWWWNIRDFPTNVSWTEETFWMSDGTSARHRRKKRNLQVQPGRPRSFTDVFKRPLQDSAEQAYVILRLYVTAESEFGQLSDRDEQCHAAKSSLFFPAHAEKASQGWKVEAGATVEGPPDRTQQVQDNTFIICTARYPWIQQYAYAAGHVPSSSRPIPNQCGWVIYY